MPAAVPTGLILTGGGARAAYQVGVVAAIERLRREAGAPGGNPFEVIAGTSAGAIIAALLTRLSWVSITPFDRPVVPPV